MFRARTIHIIHTEYPRLFPRELPSSRSYMACIHGTICRGFLYQTYGHIRRIRTVLADQIHIPPAAFTLQSLSHSRGLWPHSCKALLFLVQLSAEMLYGIQCPINYTATYQIFGHPLKYNAPSVFLPPTRSMATLLLRARQRFQPGNAV
jgi:hypothetical protein